MKSLIKLPNLLVLIQVSLITVCLISCNSTELTRLNVITELNIGESKEVVLINGDIVILELLDIEIVRDNPRGGIRAANLKVSVDGEQITIGSGNYNLPVVIGKIKIDCPVIKEHYTSSYYTRHGGSMQNDARFRLWPKDSPYIQPGTFSYPLEQRLFASRMQNQNEAAGLGWAENISNKTVGYHPSHDFGGVQGMDEIFSATDGLIISANNEIVEGYENLPVSVSNSVVWVLDDRGWYINYAHLDSVEPEVKIGSRITMGQKIGFMGKKGGSGGWIHLHFGIHYIDPETSKWEYEDGYPYLWESYVDKYNPPIKAVAGPRHLLWTGEEATLDGSKSISLSGDAVSCEWLFSDGTRAIGPVQKRLYENAGEFSEILKVTDYQGNIDYDVVYLQVLDKKYPEKQIPTIHPVYYPSLSLKPGDPVTFLVRTFGCNTGNEIWDFGDGSEKVLVNSGIVDRQTQNETEYAETVHSFAGPGHYIVRVERTNESGYKAIGHLYVVVDE